MVQPIALLWTISIFKSPKHSGETFIFFFVSSIFFHFFFFLLPKFCSDKFLVTTKPIVLKFKDMVDMDVKFFKRVSKFNMLGL